MKYLQSVTFILRILKYRCSHIQQLSNLNNCIYKFSERSAEFNIHSKNLEILMITVGSLLSGYLYKGIKKSGTTASESCVK